MTRESKSFRLSARQLELLLKHVESNVAYLNLDAILDARDSPILRSIPRVSTGLKFSNGDLVLPANEARASLVILWRGSINIFARYGTRRIFVKKIGSHSILGNMGGCWAQTMMNSVAVAAGPCEVRMLNESAANSLLDRWPRLNRRLSDIVGTKLIQMTIGYRDSEFDSVPSMLAKLLLSTADEHGIVRLTQDEIADKLGVYRPTIWKALRWMKRKGLIESRWGQITILDRDGLRELVKFPDSEPNI
jgi:CRP-like cAMP-binding protein